jgi:hypothetical protein
MTASGRIARGGRGRVVTTSLLVVVAITWLALPASTLAHDCFSRDEIKACLEASWDGFLGAIAAAALAAGLLGGNLAGSRSDGPATPPPPPPDVPQTQFPQSNAYEPGGLSIR